MQVDRKEFIAGLQKLEPFVGKKDSNCVFIFTEKYISATDHEKFMAIPNSFGLVGVIRAKDLLAILKKFKKDKIDIDIQNREVVFCSGKTIAGLSLIDARNLTLPDWTICKQDEYKLPPDFSESLSLAKSCVDKNNESIWSLVRITSQKMEATDGYRLIEVYLDNTDESYPEELHPDFFVPGDVGTALIQHRPDKVSFGEGWLIFNNKVGDLLAIRRAEVQTFPDFSRILSSITKNTLASFDLPPELDKSLQSAAVVVQEDGRDKTVTISLQKKRIVVRGDGSFGWFEESLPSAYSGDDISFVVKPDAFLNLLPHIKTAQLSEDTITFFGVNFFYVLRRQE